MKKISKLYQYDDHFFSGRLPLGLQAMRSDSEEDYPVFIKESFLSNSECHQIYEQFSSDDATDQPGAGYTGNGSVRKAYSFALQGKARELYTAAYEKTLPLMEQFFSARITGYDGAHGLGYTPGCKYDLHADNCDAHLDESGQLLEFRLSMEKRQLSSILFLTESVSELSEDYQHIGGNLSFRFLQDTNGDMLLIEPKPGLFVAFPSDPIFSHEVHEVYEVSSGFRMAIVNWYSCVKTG